MTPHHPKVDEAMRLIDHHVDNQMSDLAQLHKAVACRLVCYPDTKVEPLIGLKGSSHQDHPKAMFTWWWTEFVVGHCGDEALVMEAAWMALCHAPQAPPFDVRAAILWAGDRRWYLTWPHRSCWSPRASDRRPTTAQDVTPSGGVQTG